MGLSKHRLNGSFRRTLAGLCLVQGMLMVSFVVCARSFPFTPAVLQGVITNGASGLPVIGAKVTVNGKFTLSTAMGVYALSIDPAGTFPVTCTKAGFDTYLGPQVVFQPGMTTVLNIQLWENLNMPASVSVWLDTVPQVVPVTWTPPEGSYELLYDDGIQDNFTVWSLQGNLNAVKYTPAGFPVKVTGGSIHIGSAGNYPPGSNPFVPFQVWVFDAAGTGGIPGNSIGGPYDILPGAFGWVEFTLPSPVIISSGAFYIVMAQGGNAPNACGIAIDETNPQFRSYARFVTGGGSWYPAGGNYMMRARCEGPGGPACTEDVSLTPGLYNIYRLRQGEEQNPSVWTMVGTTPATSVTDSNWSSLPCGPFRWGVKALYPGNRWSPVKFSNILGKCWTAPVSLHLQLSCDSTNPAGTPLQLMNMAYPDTLYTAYCDSGGTVSFPRVWKGGYQLTVVRFGYDTLRQFVPVAAPVSLYLNLLQVRIPPANLSVNDSSLKARWDVPRFEKQMFLEQWGSGSLAANSWVIEGGNNWVISQALGQPAPSAMFNGMPRQINYSQSLISKNIPGQHSTLLKLKYDIYLDNFNVADVNQMAVEIWDGTTWNILKSYSNSQGNLPWTSEDLDISAYTNLNFKIRFHAYGADSRGIDNWNIDNIEIIGSEPAQEQADCILGYYFYLGNVISGYTTQNAYAIPGNLVQYGQTYNACVRALYGSGYSDFACMTFTSRFLYPVLNLAVYPIEDVAYVSWEKPMALTNPSAPPQGLIGYTIYRDDAVIAVINDPDTLSFYNYGLEPGYYRYRVTARYDLAAYGFPGQVGESVSAGPVQVTISWGHQLPFFESWNQGTFTFNEWRFNPLPGNWMMDPDEGIPAPSANFRWQPPLVDYNYSLESPSFNGLPFNCAAIWLDFDLKLNDRNYTGTEKMIVEVYYNNTWNMKAEIKNSGSLPWTNYHLDISQVRGKGFKVRFRASGQNSSEILNWYLDNISIYPVCYPASNPAGGQIGNSVLLTWSPPACYGGNLLSEGFEENSFPPPQWNVQTTNPSATWSHIPAGSPTGVHTGYFSAGLNWDYNHQDEWLIANDIFVNGDLTFWSYAFQGSLHLDHYYVKVSADQGVTWDVLLDMSALPPYPGSGGVNAWVTPYHVDLSQYEGETVDIAWHAVDGDGNGLWYPWVIDDCSIGAEDLRPEVEPADAIAPMTASSGRYPAEVLGYDIYREGSGGGGYSRINTDPVTDTTWLDAGLTPGLYRYFIQARFSECEYVSNSDTIIVDVLTGIEESVPSGISVFPNPVTDHFTVTSREKLSEISLFGFSGELVAKIFPEEPHRATFDTRTLSLGLYLLKVRSGCETRYIKICVP